LEERSNVGCRVQSRETSLGERGYIKITPPAQVAQALVPFLEAAGLQGEIQAVSPDWLAQLVVLVKERAKTLREMIDWVRPYFGQAVICDEEAARRFLTPAIAPVLGKLLARFEAFPVFSKQQWEEAFKQLVEEEGMKMGQLAQPVRVALTGARLALASSKSWRYWDETGRCFGYARGSIGHPTQEVILLSESHRS
jgi:Glutamyl- and glutaminyl-tRNA synthetases